MRVVADGLLNPLGLAQLSDSGLLIAKLGEGLGDDSAGITLITAEDEIGNLQPAITGLSTPGAFIIAPDDTIFISKVVSRGSLARCVISTVLMKISKFRRLLFAPPRLCVELFLKEIL